MDPASALLHELAASHTLAHARVADIGGPLVAPATLAARRVIPVREEQAMAYLAERARDPIEAVLAAWPTRYASLMPFLTTVSDALAPGGVAVLLDLVWQTAPTPELLRAFAPPTGRDKVRPVEGYEMQLDHAGFAIRARRDLERSAWARTLSPDARAAVDADGRGAARVVAWVLEHAND